MRLLLVVRRVDEEAVLYAVCQGSLRSKQSQDPKALVKRRSLGVTERSAFGDSRGWL